MRKLTGGRDSGGGECWLNMLIAEVPVATTDDVVFVVLKTGRVALERLVRRDHTLTVETSGGKKVKE